MMLPAHQPWFIVESREPSMVTAHINAIGAATPPHDIHAGFRDVIDQVLSQPRERALFQRMADRAAIEHRFSYFEPCWQGGRVIGDTDGFYSLDGSPSTAERMRRFETSGPRLALQALDDL